MGKIKAKAYITLYRQRKEAEDSECNLIVFDWISINLRIFASGWRELYSRHIRFRKKRYAHLVILRT
mgnify:FL=1